MLVHVGDSTWWWRIGNDDKWFTLWITVAMTNTSPKSTNKHPTCHAWLVHTHTHLVHDPHAFQPFHQVRVYSILAFGGSLPIGRNPACPIFHQLCPWFSHISPTFTNYFHDFPMNFPCLSHFLTAIRISTAQPSAPMPPSCNSWGSELRSSCHSLLLNIAHLCPFIVSFPNKNCDFPGNLT